MHAVQRCVRRAGLAVVDEKSGVDFSFRREWIRRRMEALASVFGVDVLTYAIGKIGSKYGKALVALVHVVSLQVVNPPGQARNGSGFPKFVGDIIDSLQSS